MAAFADNQAKFRDAAMKPFEQLARQNLAMFQAATDLMTAGVRPRDAAGKSAAPSEPASQNADDVQALKDQLAALQARIDGLKS